MATWIAHSLRWIWFAGLLAAVYACTLPGRPPLALNPLSSQAVSLLPPTLTPFRPLLPTPTGDGSALPGEAGSGAHSSPTILPSTPPSTPSETPTSLPAEPSAVPASPNLPPTASAPASETPTVLPVEPAAALASPTKPAEPQVSIWLDPRLPPGLTGGLALPAGLSRGETPDGAALRLELGVEALAGRWVYALAAPFPELEEGVSLDELQRAWRGEAAGSFAGRPLLLDAPTYAGFAALWGEAGPGAVNILPAEELLDRAWDERPAWALLPFEALEPRWKVLSVDGQSPLRKEFDPAAYPLSLPISLNGDPALVAAFAPQLTLGNRDPARLTTVAMTGVTALVRATAYTMEQQGVNYPGRDIGEWLRGADLTHISNEVPFAEDCPFPNPVQPDMRFCSDPRYIGLLEEVGTDIVELTGDHFQDWGGEAMLYTLDLYRQHGWSYYGGGADLEDGRKALLVEHNGNRLAFIGCNAKGGGYAQAGPGRPGAVVCDRDWMHSEIARLRAEGYLPIATFQHFEYYTYRAQPNQEQDFRGMAEAGAVIVSGSQAHQPQAFDFVGPALIHYGLGNLFFDQYDVSLPCRQGFIDRHVFYAGRYLGVELLPILFVDYARPRPMTAQEQDELLNAVFRASGW